MKKVCISFLVLAIIFLSVVGVSLNATQPTKEYLRIHIRANSDRQQDQAVKYQVRDAVISFLTPKIAQVKDKKGATKMLNDNLETITQVAVGVLEQNGFYYGASVKIKNEQFPTRVYGDFTLNQGFYDALIIELGSAQGQNWWCVVYPPLCFTGGSNNYVINSKIVEMIKAFKQRIGR